MANNNTLIRKQLPSQNMQGAYETGSAVAAVGVFGTLGLLNILITPLAMYHGYYRNEKEGAVSHALLWGLGSMFMGVPLLGVILAQGIGQKD